MFRRYRDRCGNRGNICRSPIARISAAKIGITALPTQLVRLRRPPSKDPLFMLRLAGLYMLQFLVSVKRAADGWFGWRLRTKALAALLLHRHRT